MLNRPATKIDLNIEEENCEFDEMKKNRIQNPIQFEKQFKTEEILHLLPNYQNDSNLNISNNKKDNTSNLNDFNPHEFNFSDGKNNIEEFKLNNDFSPKEFTLGDVTIQEKSQNVKSNEKILPGVKLFSSP